jgi:hypothetical protein
MGVRQRAAVQVFVLPLQRQTENTLRHARHGETQRAQTRSAQLVVQQIAVRPPPTISNLESRGVWCNRNILYFCKRRFIVLYASTSRAEKDVPRYSKLVGLVRFKLYLFAPNLG